MPVVTAIADVESTFGALHPSEPRTPEIPATTNPALQELF